MFSTRRACIALALVLAASAGACRTAGDASLDSDARGRLAPGVVVLGDHGTVVTGSGARHVAPGTYLRSAGSARAVLVVERAHDLVLDLSGVTLRGSAAGTDLDLHRGIGIQLVDCDKVKIVGGTIGGYKVCVAAERCRDIQLDGVRFDAWYGSRLLSTRVAEDEADWLFPHQNDDGEWVEKYGAAIALTDCERATIARCSGRHGQNGILLVRTNACTLYDDDFSFLSGWGLALYRASHNRVSHCIFDYCVRGYSHDVYWRGQDSAGILMFERSCDNVFVENSATHGGDGVFLFAGRDKVEGQALLRGEQDAGGSDRNIWYRNDFSFAVANSIEATFSSDNWAIGNRLNGSHQHGVWGGYSERMVILANEISNTLGGGVSIEHGQECAIVGNTLEDDDAGLELWWDEDPVLVNGPYGKHHDTQSRGHLVSNDRFAHNAKDLEISHTRALAFRANEFASKKHALKLEDVTVAPDASPKLEVMTLIAGVDGSSPSGTLRDVALEPYPATEPEWLVRARAYAPPNLPGKLVTFESERNESGGLDTIVMGEWGPWDFRSGEPRPKQRDPGGLFATAQWNATWFAWSPASGDQRGTDPRKDVEAWRKLASAPLVTGTVRAWTDPWGSSKETRTKVGTAHFGLIARTTLTLAEGGAHRLAVTSDDGVRVQVDGQVVLENWTWHGPTRDTAEIQLARGEHTFELEYFQIDGASALALELERVTGP